MLPSHTIRIRKLNYLLKRRRIWNCAFEARVDWGVWLPGICQVGRLVRRPGGPPRHMLK